MEAECPSFKGRRGIGALHLFDCLDGRTAMAACWRILGRGANGSILKRKPGKSHMRPIMLLSAILLALPMSGCTSPTATETSDGGVVIRHMAAEDDADSLQALADTECGKRGLKAHFNYYESGTLLGPRDAYFDCVSS
jgi:hypothetical protein